MFKNYRVKTHIIYISGIYGGPFNFKDKGAALRFMSTMKSYKCPGEYRTGYTWNGMVTAKSYIESVLFLRRQQMLRELNSDVSHQ